MGACLGKGSEGRKGEGRGKRRQEGERGQERGRGKEGGGKTEGGRERERGRGPGRGKEGGGRGEGKRDVGEERGKRGGGEKRGVGRCDRTAVAVKIILFTPLNKDILIHTTSPGEGWAPLNPAYTQPPQALLEFIPLCYPWEGKGGAM